MISAVIPTLNAEKTLASTLAALVPAAVDGLVREVIVVDGGSTDRTRDIVEDSGARLLAKSGACGYQLAVGAMRSGQPWLLFLLPGTVLEPGWEREASQFMERIDMGKRPSSAAVFRLALEDQGGARWHERLATLRGPGGNQGLLIPRHLYEKVGEHRPVQRYDVDLIRRLGRRRITMFSSRAIVERAQA